MDLVIYGAQSIALGAYEAIHNLYPAKEVRCFLVTERAMNAESISGVPVYVLNDFSKTLSLEEKNNIEILIATPENVMSEIEKNLDEQKMFCHVRLTSLQWAKMMGYYYAANKEYIPLSALPCGYHRADLNMFMAKYHKDKVLKNRYCLPEWITPIQVGAALCDMRVADVLDCQGENISYKNPNYSELTALYWVWKNCLLSKADDENYKYYGLSHYRRVLELTEEDIMKLADNDVDVVLPYPMPYEPNVNAHHERYIKKEDWEAVICATQELQPKYAEKFPCIMKQKFLYNYNIILAKKDVLTKYCNWLFPILERVEELSLPKGHERADRYMGYIGETLETLYFTVNKEWLNITHAGCRFLI